MLKHIQAGSGRIGMKTPNNTLFFNTLFLYYCLPIPELYQVPGEISFVRTSAYVGCVCVCVFV